MHESEVIGSCSRKGIAAGGTRFGGLWWARWKKERERFSADSAQVPSADWPYILDGEPTGLTLLRRHRLIKLGMVHRDPTGGAIPDTVPSVGGSAKEIRLVHVTHAAE